MYDCGVLNKFILHFLPVFALHVDFYAYPQFSEKDFWDKPYTSQSMFTCSKQLVQS